MRQSVVAAVSTLLAFVTWGCGGPRPAPVMVPPQIDLHPHETIGILRFDAAVKGELAPMATRRFTEAARRDQGLVRIVELGPTSEALREVGRDRLDPEAVMAIGRKHGVKSIVAGELVVSSVRPDVRVDAMLRSGSISAQVDATLEVQLFETQSGTVLWNRSGRATRTVGNVHVASGNAPAFDARNPTESYGGLVDDLVAQVSRPFQVSWATP